MNYSQSGLKMTEQFEACRLDAYQDIKGIWTVGYGHTGPDVYPGLSITPLQAEQFLLNDIQNAVNCVNSLVTVPLTQGEFDALTDFAFNYGCGAFAGSTMLRLLNAGGLPRRCRAIRPVGSRGRSGRSWPAAQARSGNAGVPVMSHHRDSQVAHDCDRTYPRRTHCI